MRSDAPDENPPGFSASSSASIRADGGTDADYFGCEESSDCVAVPLISSCCYSGWKIAVDRDEAAANLAATECPPQPRHICPLYVVLDTRVPVCGDRRCKMVAPEAGDGCGDEDE